MRDSRKARTQQKALRKPFLIFAAIVSLLCLSVILFIQSRSFTSIFKKVAKKYVPSDLGIDGDFSSLSVKLFPPGISIVEPKVTLREKNVLGLPGGSHVEADRIDLGFRPFQMLSGNIQVHRITIVHGNVDLKFDRLESRQKKKSNFSWDELFKIRAEALSLEDTKVHLSFQDPKLSAQFVARHVDLTQVSASRGSFRRETLRGYEIEIDLKDLQAELPPDWQVKVPTSLDSVRMIAGLNPERLEVRSLLLARQGVELNAQGQIKGDFLHPKGLLVDSTLQVRGDLAEMLKYADQAPKPRKAADDRSANSPSGQVSFNGHLKGDLRKPGETLHFEGALGAASLKYGNFETDHLEAEGTWTSAPGGGEFSVARASVDSALKERSGGNQPGSGGKVQIGSFKYRLGSTQPVNVKVELNRAHLHWLGAAVLDSLYAVDSRLSGPADLVIVPDRKNWSINAQVDFKAENFQLDNQRLGKTIPMTRILKIPEFRAHGGFIVDSKNFRANGLFANLKETQLEVTGKVDYKTGFDLTGKGPVNLHEISEIAETVIDGRGSVIVHVRGPASGVAIDFDADLEGAEYLRLKFGQFKGRITWDDSTHQILFTRIQARKNETAYGVNGAILLTSPSKINLDADIPQGDIQDFLQIFQELTKNLSWLPRTLNGDMVGKVKISGGLSLDQLSVLAQVQGKNWDYLGEKFKAVNLSGGYEKGKYLVNSFTALKRTGLLSGRISYDEKAILDWDLKSENFSLSDLDHIARLDVPIRGQIQINSKGRGPDGGIESVSTFGLTDLVVRGNTSPSSELSIRSQGGVAEVRGSGLGGQATLQASYNFKVGGNSSIHSQFRHFDFSPMLLLINSKLIQDPALAGFVSGTCTLDFKTGNIEEGSGQAQLTEYQLAKTGTRFSLVNPVQFKIDHGTFDLHDLSVQGAFGQANLSLKGRRGRLDGKVDGDLDISIIEFFTSVVTQSLGAAHLDFTIQGNLKEPELEGVATLSGAVVRIPAVESAFENVMGEVSLKSNVITVKGLEADLASGRVQAGGRVELFTDRYPLIALSGTVSGSKLKVYPFQVAKVRGKINLHGGEIPYLVDGNLTVDSAISREKVFSPGQGPALKTASYTPPPSAAHSSDYPLFKLNLNVSAPGNILVQNELFDAELKGELAIVNTIEAPRILGSAQVVQGKLTFKDRVFQIQSANVEFDNPTVINPKFNLSATTEVNNRKIQLYVIGRLANSDFKINLTSNPVMPEPEILSLLALGFSADDKRLRASDRSAYEQGEAASLLLHSMDFNRDVKNKTGFQIELDEVVNEQAVSSAFRPSTTTEGASAPKIVIKRQIGQRVDLSVGSTVGVGSNTQKQIAAEVRVTPAFSVLGVWEDFETVDTKDARRSYGVDLKVQKRFK
ncbi:MAG: translocation/assembly module TamB domain-containing protein [Methylotenera sp.]|nr:translocation/assembly module TamB domain-containing protein [Oligoflexia bacterium]